MIASRIGRIPGPFGILSLESCETFTSAEIPTDPGATYYKTPKSTANGYMDARPRSSMSERIRAEIGIRADDTCLVADSSQEIERAITDIRRSSVPDDDGRIVEEFTATNGSSFERESLEEVFVSDSHTVYQFRRDPAGDCICRSIERFGCPISDLHARDGTLYVSFHAPDIETIQDIVAELQENYEGVHVRHLTQGDNRTDTDLAIVDRSQLTQKQRDAVETAHVMGYFEHPRRANAVDVAEELDIAPATFTEHLAAAQRKIFDELLRS